VFAEFAVFEPAELTGIPFARGRIVWKQPHVEESIAIPVLAGAPRAGRDRVAGRRGPDQPLCRPGPLPARREAVRRPADPGPCGRPHPGAGPPHRAGGFLPSRPVLHRAAVRAALSHRGLRAAALHSGP
jgi:hypothetical protein